MSEKNKKIALVTGANRGIGFSIVKKLSEEFYGIIYLTAKNPDKGEKLIRELNNLEIKKVRYIELDVEDENSIKKLADRIQEAHGGLDILINNTDINNTPKKNAANSEPLIETALDCEAKNLVGILSICKAFFPLLRENARVVNISSRLGMLSQISSKEIKEKLSSRNEHLTPEDIVKIMRDYVEAVRVNNYKHLHISPYGMSKACLTALTRVHQKSLDVDERHIVVSAVCPGLVKLEESGNKGIYLPDEGAETPVYLALLPSDFDGARGAFWAEKTTVNWEAGSMYWEFLRKTPHMFKSLINHRTHL